MKIIAIQTVVHVIILAVLCIFVDFALPKILMDPNWLKYLEFMLVICLLTASLDVSSLELKVSIDSAKPRVSCCFFWVYLVMTVIFSVWIYYVITCGQEFFVMDKYFMIKKVFPFLMLLYSLAYSSQHFLSSDWLKSLVFCNLEK